MIVINDVLCVLYYKCVTLVNVASSSVALALARVNNYATICHLQS